ncbi:MAG TPA: hypothetical protein DEP84_25540, partial [Chloroflexi bacterium]|nr:hypothetical protein [Chloroflexota bacterium]
MAVLNPTMGGVSPLRGRSEGSREQARRYHDQVEQVLLDVDEFVSFITDVEGHTSARTLVAFWEGEARAQITLRSLGRLLGQDLASDLRAVEESLDSSTSYPLPDFNETVTPHLFSLIDGIEPAEMIVADGREGAEQYHYACELRTALLQYVLGVINERYQVPKFQNLLQASQWIDAFSSILQEADAVVDGTYQLLRDEALAVQSYLDRQRAQLERLDRETRSRDVLIRRLGWREQLAAAEEHIINFLADRAESVERITFERIAADKSPGAVEMLAVHTARRAPKLGLLLLGLASAATGVAGFKATGRPLPTIGGLEIPTPIRGQASEQETARQVALGRQKTSFGVVPRQFVELTAPAAAAEADSASSKAEAITVQPAADGKDKTASVQPGSRAGDAVSRFFNDLSGSKGRQELTIKESSTLNRVLTELERFGYPKRDVLDLLGLSDASALRAPVSVGVRMSQGQRLLLFPPQRTTDSSVATPVIRPAYTIQKGDTLFAIARAFGISLDTLVESNPQFKNPDRIEIGQTVIIPGPTWAEAQRNQPLIRWGDQLNRIGELLGVAPETLASLNNIAQPDQWIYDGRPLVLPVDVVAPEHAQALLVSRRGQGAAASAEEETEKAPAVVVTAEVRSGAQSTAGSAPPAAPSSTASSPATSVSALVPDEVFRVHVARPGDSLVSLAEAFDTTVKQIMSDNGLSGDQLVPGQTLLIRGSRHQRPPAARIFDATASGRTETLSSETGSGGVNLVAPIDSADVTSGGGLGDQTTAGRELPPPTASGFGVLGSNSGESSSTLRVQGADLVAQYGGQTWPSLEAMPAEVRRYFVATLDEVAAFFNVRPEDIAGILRAEQNNRGWTLHEPGVSTAGARGVAQVVARTWNGWSNPRRDGP